MDASNYSHHPFIRMGNKWTDIKDFDDLLPTDVKQVVEPFAGTWAVTRRHYFDPKYKKHINDSDQEFMKAQEWAFKNPVKTANIYRNSKETSAENKAYINNLRGVPSETKAHLIRKLDVGVYTNQFKLPSTVYIPLALMFDSIKRTASDYKAIFKQYLNKQNAFVFIDPPYFESYNNDYKVGEQSIEKVYNDILKFLQTTKAKTMVVIPEDRVTKTLFKGLIRRSYVKRYQLSRSVKKLLVITNY